MSEFLTLVLHRRPERTQEINRWLEDAGCRVIGLSDLGQARDLAATLDPDFVVVELGLLEREGDQGVRSWLDDPALDGVELVALVGTAPDEPGRAADVGVPRVLSEFCTQTEIRELVRGSDASTEDPDVESLTGDLRHFSAAEVISMIEISRKSGFVDFKNPEASARLVYRHGQLERAVASDGRLGEDVVGAVLGWKTGRFEASFEAASEETSGKPPKRSATTSEVSASPPVVAGADAAASTDPASSGASAETDRGRDAHRALAALNLAASHLSAEIEGQIVGRHLERARLEIQPDHPAASEFRVDGEAVALVGAPALDDGEWAVMARRWLETTFADLERTFPGRFDESLVSSVIAAVEDA